MSTVRDTKIILTKRAMGRKIMNWMSLFVRRDTKWIKMYEWFLGALDEEGEEGVKGFMHNLIRSLTKEGIQRFDHEQGEWILEIDNTKDGWFIQHRWGNFTARMPEDFLEALKEAEILTSDKALKRDTLVD